MALLVTHAAGSAAAAQEGPVLDDLRLSRGDFQALTRQGFVSAESRRGRRPVYKLRWRRGGKQQVRYLGQDPARAEEVRLELEALQFRRRCARYVIRLMGAARPHLRRAKRLLAAHAAAHGWH